MIPPNPFDKTCIFFKGCVASVPLRVARTSAQRRTRWAGPPRVPRCTSRCRPSSASPPPPRSSQRAGRKPGWTARPGETKAVRMRWINCTFFPPFYKGDGRSPWSCGCTRRRGPSSCPEILPATSRSPPTPPSSSPVRRYSNEVVMIYLAAKFSL